MVGLPMFVQVSQRGWFNLYYYEDGSSYSQSSGYIYTSFQKTAKIWWDPWQGGAGAIYSTIDGSGSGYPIAEVDNCSRVIKYVVTLGQRYSTYSLVDMRIHDINVVADLTRHDPTAPDPDEPVDYDGTSTSSGEDSARVHEQDTEAMTDQADASISIYWTGPWPELHIDVMKQISVEISLTVHSKVDLLAAVSVENVDLKLNGTEDMTEDEARTFTTLVATKTSTCSFWSDVVQGLMVAVWAALLVIEVLAMAPVVLQTGVIVLACLCLFSLYLWLMWSLVFAIRQMDMTFRDGQWTFLTAALSVLGMGAVSALWLHWSPLGFMKALGYFSSGWARSNSLTGYHGRANVVVFIAMMVLLVITVLTYYGMIQGWW